MNGSEVFWVGNLAADPELRFSANGTAVARFSVAVNRYRGRDAEAQEGDTFFARCIAFGDFAENVAELSKGDRVFIAGRIRTEKWTDPEGNTHYATRIVVDDAGPSLRYAKAQVQKLARRGYDAPPPETYDAPRTREPVGVGAVASSRGAGPTEQGRPVEVDYDF